VNEGKHEEEFEDGRDGMPGAGQLPCDDNVCAVEQSPQDGGSPRALPESPGQKQQHQATQKGAEMRLYADGNVAERGQHNDEG
jgi:hypothetical protein